MHKTRPVRLGIYSAPVSGTLRVIFCGQLVARKSLITMVALTGIEPAGYQFSSVQLGLSSCVFGLVQFATRAFRAVWMADVLPRCCPATRIRLLKIPDSLARG